MCETWSHIQEHKIDTTFETEAVEENIWLYKTGSGMGEKCILSSFMICVFKSIKHKMHHEGVFWDLEEAFDCINHEILLVKLHFCGIRGISADWLRYCFTNRRQQVAINSPKTTQNFFSNWVTLKRWVPQGSILGPLLFMICMNNFPLRINSVS